MAVRGKMSDQVPIELLAERFAETLMRLGKAIDRCPSDLWNRSGGGERYWYLVYHALFFLDLHLTDSPKGFRPPKPFRILGVDFTGKGHDNPYSKHDLKRYVEHNRRKAVSRIASLTREDARRPSGFPWLSLTVEGLLNYNLLHVNEYLQKMNRKLDEERR
jgi:hypothetical protein